MYRFITLTYWQVNLQEVSSWVSASCDFVQKNYCLNSFIIFICLFIFCKVIRLQNIYTFEVLKGKLIWHDIVNYFNSSLPIKNNVIKTFVCSIDTLHDQIICEIQLWPNISRKLSLIISYHTILKILAK